MEANRLHNNQGNLMHWPRPSLRICISHGPPDDGVAEHAKEKQPILTDGSRRQPGSAARRHCPLPSLRGERPHVASPSRRYPSLHSQPSPPPSGSTLRGTPNARPLVDGGKGWRLCTLSVAWLVTAPQRADVIPVDAEFGLEARDLHLRRPGPGEAVRSILSAGAPAQSLWSVCPRFPAVVWAGRGGKTNSLSV